MKQSSELKDIALSALRGNWGRALVLPIVFFLIVAVFYAAFFCITFFSVYNSGGEDHLASLMVLPVALPFALIAFIFIVVTYVFGMQMTFVDFVRGNNQALKVSDAFSFGFKNLGVIFLRLLYIYAWSLLLYIPGIIKAYSYAMTPYIVKDNPGIGADAAIHASRELMRGHKLDLFVLQLTFIGWYFLSYFTCGIGFLFLISYYQATEAAFYQNLLEECTASAPSATSSSDMKF
ncbi:MAG: DUF975 family protein [Bacteroidaceae bacterium]|nr:DUF975 family protein [Bacteroidaceae bacterium]